MHHVVELVCLRFFRVGSLFDTFWLHQWGGSLLHLFLFESGGFYFWGLFLVFFDADGIATFEYLLFGASV